MKGYIMNIKSILTLLAILFCLPQLTFAHGGGHGPVLSEKEVMAAATDGVYGLVKEGTEVENTKLDKSWQDVPASDKKLVAKGQGYYIFGFNNQKQNKILYLLVSPSGELYDANFSGKFEGIK